MGDVKDAVVGSGRQRKPGRRAPSGPGSTGDEQEDRPVNIQQELTNLAFEISDLCAEKEGDVLDESPSEAPNNQRKAALLRAAHALVNAAATILETYADDLPAAPAAEADL